MSHKEIAYPLASTTWDQEEYAALARVIASGRFTMGKEVLEFEQAFAEYVGTKHAVMFNSGSSANLGLIAAARYMKNPILQPGDEVIVPAVSWSTTYYPVHQQELVLSFVDIEIDTLNIDLKKVEEAITSKTRAIFAVNLWLPCAIWPLRMGWCYLKIIVNHLEQSRTNNLLAPSDWEEVSQLSLVTISQQWRVD